MSLIRPPWNEDPLVDLAVPGAAVDDEPGEEATTRPRSGFWRRFLHQPFALGGLAFILLVIVTAIFAPLIAPYPPNLQNLNLVNAGPSAAHWLGTDDLGRDILSRLIWGGGILL